MQKISITFFAPKGRINKAGCISIFCRLTQNNDRKKLSTGVSLPPNLWDKHKHKAKGTTHHARTANETLDNMTRELEAILLEANKAKENITPEILRQRYKCPTPTHTLLSLWDYYLKNARIDKAEGTLRTYITRENNIRAFLKDKLQVNDLPYQHIIAAHGHDLYNFLRTKKNAKHQNNGHNFSAKVVMSLRSAFEYAFKSGWVDKNVWLNINYSQKNKGIIESLTYEEMEKLASKVFDIPRIQQVADCFILQASCGLAYVDFSKLKKDNFQKNQYDSRTWIFTQRQKTGEQVVAPILPFGLKILEKYGGIENVPINTNECYNLYLKEIANVLGFKINLTTHIARKTFGMLSLNHYDIDIKVVSKVLGHSTIATTQKNYARVDVRSLTNGYNNALSK